MFCQLGCIQVLYFVIIDQALCNVGTWLPQMLLYEIYYYWSPFLCLCNTHVQAYLCRKENFHHKHNLIFTLQCVDYLMVLP